MLGPLLGISYKTYIPVCVCAKQLQSYLTLCNPRDCSPLGSSVHGILQARILEWVAMPFSRGYSPLRDGICGSCTAGDSLLSEPQVPGEDDTSIRL